jgi:hypothetical protein
MTAEIRDYIRGHENTVAPLLKDYNLKFWELSLNGTEDREKALVEAKARFLKVYSNREEFRRLRE